MRFLLTTAFVGIFAACTLGQVVAPTTSNDLWHLTAEPQANFKLLDSAVTPSAEKYLLLNKDGHLVVDKLSSDDQLVFEADLGSRPGLDLYGEYIAVNPKTGVVYASFSYTGATGVRSILYRLDSEGTIRKQRSFSTIGPAARIDKLTVSPDGTLIMAAAGRATSAETFKNYVYRLNPTNLSILNTSAPFTGRTRNLITNDWGDIFGTGADQYIFYVKSDFSAQRELFGHYKGIPVNFSKIAVDPTEDYAIAVGDTGVAGARKPVFLALRPVRQLSIKSDVYLMSDEEGTATDVVRNGEGTWFIAEVSKTEATLSGWIWSQQVRNHPAFLGSYPTLVKSPVADLAVWSDGSISMITDPSDSGPGLRLLNYDKYMFEQNLAKAAYEPVRSYTDTLFSSTTQLFTTDLGICAIVPQLNGNVTSSSASLIPGPDDFYSFQSGQPIAVGREKGVLVNDPFGFDASFHTAEVSGLFSGFVALHLQSNGSFTGKVSSGFHGDAVFSYNELVNGEYRATHTVTVTIK